MTDASPSPDGRPADAGPSPDDRSTDASATRETARRSDGDETPTVDSGRDPEPDGEREGSASDDPTVGSARDLGRGIFEEEMGPGSSLAHLYRGEIHRMKFWRERLDRTTNWAVTTIAAILTFAFSSPDNPHYLLLAAAVMLGIFLVVEARRYRGYDVWRSRVRVLQENVIAHGLDPRTPVRDERWRERLSDDYREPTLKITVEEALAHRLRRVYLPLFSVVVGAWVLRVTVTASTAWPASAAIGSVPGRTTTAVVVLAYAVLLVVAFRPREWQAESELRTEDVSAWNDRP